MSDYQLPLFPLPLVVYPDQRIPLYIFEERYQQMIRYCLETEERFGIVLQQEGKLSDIGCTVRIERVLEAYPDGTMDILAIGEQRFRIEQLLQERMYLTATIEPVHDVPAPPGEDQRERLITQHMKLLEMIGEPLRPQAYDASPSVSFIVAQNAGLDLGQQQRLLEMPSEHARVDFLVQHLEALLPRLRHLRDIRRRISGDGYFGSELPELGF